jgi:hypothetical protein
VDYALSETEKGKCAMHCAQAKVKLAGTPHVDRIGAPSYRLCK